MQVVLEVQNSEASARIVKARLERTSLGQVAQSINVVLQPNAVGSLPCTLPLLPAEATFDLKAIRVILPNTDILPKL